MNGCAPTSSTSLTNSSTSATPRIVRQPNPARTSLLRREARAQEDTMQVDLPAVDHHRQFGQHGEALELRGDVVERPPGVLEQDGVLARMRLGIEPEIVLVAAGEQARHVPVVA